MIYYEENRNWYMIPDQVFKTARDLFKVTNPEQSMGVKTSYSDRVGEQLAVSQAVINEYVMNNSDRFGQLIRLSLFYQKHKVSEGWYELNCPYQTGGYLVTLGELNRGLSKEYYLRPEFLVISQVPSPNTD